MPLSYDTPLNAVAIPARTSTSACATLVSVPLEQRFELIKEIGDGSFGSVALARVRTAGAQVARRGTLIAIKTMKKVFESEGPCLELREIVFLRTVPHHVHLVPALDIFLDPLTRKLHICMENMDGNLYQLMKSRDHKCLDIASVKSILYQILSGLSHIHNHQFFHRDIKPENILVTSSAPHDASSHTLRRYSSMMTPPITPPVYSIKIADFGLAREFHSPAPYTTYVSTRWYRAPEVLLRAGSYSAPVDLWALGAMAVEVATLKPLFPGANEVDQVWRVCEIMGSPGNWYDKSGGRVGGGDWRDGVRLASKLGFSFPKMAPHSMDTILQPLIWGSAFSQFVTSCLLWDPRQRPTSEEALRHEFFADAVDPLRPRSAIPTALSKKTPTADLRPQREPVDTQAPTKDRQSWFRRSLIKDNSGSLSSHASNNGTEVSTQVPAPMQLPTPGSTPMPSRVEIPTTHSGGSSKFRPFGSKRATMNIPASGLARPMLPSMRPVTPLSANVQSPRPTVAQPTVPIPSSILLSAAAPAVSDSKASRKIGRQLSIQSQSNRYVDDPKIEGEYLMNGVQSPQSPTAEQKEGFFSHLRKRARRFSGKPVGASSLVLPDQVHADGETASGRSPRHSNRNSLAIDPKIDNVLWQDRTEAEKSALPSRFSLTSTHQVGDASMDALNTGHLTSRKPYASKSGYRKDASTRHSLSKSMSTSALDSSMVTELPLGEATAQPVSSRTRRAAHHQSGNFVSSVTPTPSSTSPDMFGAPDEVDELLQENHSVGVSGGRSKADRRLRADDALHRRASATTLLPLSINPLATSTTDPRSPSIGASGYPTPSYTETPGHLAAHINPYPTPSPSAKRNGVHFSNPLKAAKSSNKVSQRSTIKENSLPMTLGAWPNTPPYEDKEWAASAAADIFAAGTNCVR